MFKDVKETDWYYLTIQRMEKLGLISGYPDGTFKPKNITNRAEVAAMLCNFYMAKKELIKKLAFSVVKIVNKSAGCEGSGVVIDKELKLLATNVHVIIGDNGLDPADECFVYLHEKPEKGYKTFVKYGDFGQDIAIIQCKDIPEEFLNPVKIANKINWLDEIIVIGNALKYMNSASVGYVSFEKRQFGNYDFIQTDAAINPGNSGGGAFNLAGELVGLPTFQEVWADKAQTRPVFGMGFLTPCYHIQRYYQMVKAGTAIGFPLKGEKVKFVL